MARDEVITLKWKIRDIDEDMSKYKDEMENYKAQEGIKLKKMLEEHRIETENVEEKNEYLQCQLQKVKEINLDLQDKIKIAESNLAKEKNDHQETKDQLDFLAGKYE